MNEIVVNQPYKFECGGKELAKILYYYGYIPDGNSEEYKIVCPFHEDVNPSMIVNIRKGTWFCFGCGLSGNAVDFVSQSNPELNELQSLIKFLKILKSEKADSLDFSHRKKIKKKSEAELYDIAWDYYYGLSKIDWKSSEQEEATFCKKYMEERGFSPNTLNKCQAKITYNSNYPIIFPMLDNGEFKGWVCRTTDKEVEQKRKYLYNRGFSRATTLVGDYKDQEFVFVVEGYMDRLKFIQYGVTNVVAILGWKMSKEQEEKLKREQVKYIISALDNDDCGKKGTKYLRTIFDKVYRFKYLKGIKDPGQMTKEQFQKCIDKTMKEIANTYV